MILFWSTLHTQLPAPLSHDAFFWCKPLILESSAFLGIIFRKSEEELSSNQGTSWKAEDYRPGVRDQVSDLGEKIGEWALQSERPGSKGLGSDWLGERAIREWALRSERLGRKGFGRKFLVIEQIWGQVIVEWLKKVIEVEVGLWKPILEKV